MHVPLPYSGSATQRRRLLARRRLQYQPRFCGHKASLNTKPFKPSVAQGSHSCILGPLDILFSDIQDLVSHFVHALIPSTAHGFIFFTLIPSIFFVSPFSISATVNHFQWRINATRYMYLSCLPFTTSTHRCVHTSLYNPCRDMRSGACHVMSIELVFDSHTDSQDSSCVQERQRQRQRPTTWHLQSRQKPQSANCFLPTLLPPCL